MSFFANASPEAIMLGADDHSTRIVTPTPEPLPQHLPKFYIFAAKGTTKPVLISSAKFPLLYGTATFDPNGKFFNHATLFLTGIAGEGNTCMVQRVVPDDAGVKANVQVWIDVLRTDVPNYLRTSTGDLVVDSATNSYKVDTDTPTIPGMYIKYIKDYDAENENTLGLLTPKNGTMSDSHGNKSTMYPLFESRASEYGEPYNNNGFSFTSYFKSDLDQKAVAGSKSMVFGISLHTRADAKSSPAIFRSMDGEPVVNFSLRPKVINPNTKSRFDLEYVFGTKFFNETDELKALRYNEYEGLYFYRNYYELVTSFIMENEAQYVSDEYQTWNDGAEASTASWFDFTTTDATELMDEAYMLNLFACKSSRNIKYFTVMYNDDLAVTTGNQKEINLSTNTPVFLMGGSDGTLSNENFEAKVVAELHKYIDSDSEVQDLAINVESVFYDSGFTPDTKLEIGSFIGLRKDTNIILTTHDASLKDKCLSLSDARAVGVALRSRLKLVPESEYFGTGVARALIVVGAGKLRGGDGNYVPASYEVALKAAAMMGAGDGEWKKEKLFDKAPGNILDNLIEVSPAFIPSGIKPTMWNDGLSWAQPYDREQYHFPALQTVYDDDTSVMNNFFTVMALGTLTKVGFEAWLNHTGTTDLTDGEFISAINNFVNKRTQNRFAGMFVVIPEAVITEADSQRGYSWRLIVKLYANNMRTKMVYNSEVYRMSDLAQ